MPAVDPDSELIISWNGDVSLNKNWKNRTVTRNSPWSPWTVDSVIFAAVRRKKAQTSTILQLQNAHNGVFHMNAFLCYGYH